MLCGGFSLVPMITNLLSSKCEPNSDPDSRLITDGSWEAREPPRFLLEVVTIYVLHIITVLRKDRRIPRCTGVFFCPLLPIFTLSHCFYLLLSCLRKCNIVLNSSSKVLLKPRVLLSEELMSRPATFHRLHMGRVTTGPNPVFNRIDHDQPTTVQYPRLSIKCILLYIVMVVTVVLKLNNIFRHLSTIEEEKLYLASNQMNIQVFK